MILTYDIETMIKISGKYKMGLGYKDYILIGLYDGENYKQFINFEDMLYFIYENYKGTNYLYAHNGGKYDVLYMLDSIKKMRLSKCNININNMLIINSNLSFDIHFSNRKILKVRDSILLLPQALDPLLYSYDISTQKLKMNYNKLYELKDIEDYLYNDCVGLHQLILTFQEQINTILEKKNMKIKLERHKTIASLSFSIVNHCYLNGGIKNHMKVEDEEFVRKAYHGGRVEVYKRFGSNLNYYDVNSLYPFVMSEFEYPTGSHFYTNNPLHYIESI